MSSQTLPVDPFCNPCWSAKSQDVKNWERFSHMSDPAKTFEETFSC